MYTEESLNSPFASSDAVYNSIGGIAVGLAADFYADHVYESTLGGYASLNKDLKFDMRKSSEWRREFVNSHRDNLDARWPALGPDSPRGKIEGMLRDRLDDASEAPGWGKQRIRRKINAGANWLADASPWGKNFIRGIVDTPDLYKRRVALRRSVADVIANPGTPEGLRDALGVARKARALGVVGMSIGFSQLGFELGSAITGAVASRGREARAMSRSPVMAGQGFQDSRMAYTTRQQAMRAMQLSQSGMQRALGNEASYLHQFH